MKLSKETVQQRWHELIREQTASGQSIKAFCRARELRAWQFYEWKKRLQQSDTGSFVAVSVKVDDEKIPLSSATLSISAIELRHSRGWSLLIEPGFDAVHLRRVLAVVESGA